MEELNHLSNIEVVVYRALRKSSWIVIEEDTKEVAPEAYFLRQKKDGTYEKGLSVCLESKCVPEDCCKDSLSRHYGIVSLSTECLTSLGLTVEPDPPPDEHAVILNVPSRSDDAKQAEYLARALARNSVWQCDGRK